jgi:mRNA interferase MazF
MADPRRGEVWLTDLGLAAKVRPCLVLSVPFIGDERSLVTLVPHTTSPRQSRFEATLNVRFLREGVFDAQSLVTVPSVRLIRLLGTLRLADLKTVESMVSRWLGLPTPPD